MRSARKLKGTNIYFNDDLCAASQAIKNAQMPLMKQARAAGKIAYFRHTKLIVKDRLVTEAPSSLFRGQQQDVDASTARRRGSLTDGATSEDEATVSGARVQGGGVGGAREVQAYPPLTPQAGPAGSPATRPSPHSHAVGAASSPHPQEVRPKSTRNIKKK